jgi:hypothetical protein
VDAINGAQSKDPAMMHLLRHLALFACQQQFDFRCQHIEGVRNQVADILSRDGPSPQFRALCPNAREQPADMAIVPLPPPEDSWVRRA